jgi:hypothetical protein
MWKSLTDSKDSVPYLDSMVLCCLGNAKRIEDGQCLLTTLVPGPLVGPIHVLQSKPIGFAKYDTSLLQSFDISLGAQVIRVSTFHNMPPALRGCIRST